MNQLALHHQIDIIGFQILKNAIKFESEIKDDKIHFKFSICGQSYELGPFSQDMMKAPNKDELIQEAWIQIFEKFEHDLDKGVEFSDIKIIQPESPKLIL